MNLLTRLLIVCVLAILPNTATHAQISILDFGAPGQKLYNGTLFTGVPTLAEDAGTTGANSSLTGVEYDLGDVTLIFNLVGAINADGSGAIASTSLGALNQSYFFTSVVNPVVPENVTFSINTTDPNVIVGFEFIGSNVSDRVPEITIVDDGDGSNMISGQINSSSSFVSIGSLTGALSYTGTFTHTSDSNASHIGGARITISTVPEPTTVSTLLFCAVLYGYGRRRRDSQLRTRLQSD